MSSSARAIVRAHGLIEARVQRMVTLLEARSDGIIERLRQDAVEELRLWSDLEIVALDAMPPTDCAIAGVYLPTSRPPRIGLWSQMAKPRAMFTALHELGHHLQQSDDGLIDELDGEPDMGAYLEERSSDALAARILLPPDMVKRVLGAGTPAADQVTRLWRESGVSRAAVCVAAARQLTSPGHVVLLHDGIVQFSASFGEPPLRRGSDQSSTAIIKAQARSALAIVSSEETRFQYRDGIQGTPLYAQAAFVGGYTVVVAVSHQAPWRPMSLPLAAPPLIGTWQTCGRCDHTFQAWGERCKTCRSGHCPECGRCDCESRVEELLCSKCFLTKPAHLFVDDLCDECLA